MAALLSINCKCFLLNYLNSCSSLTTLRLWHVYILTPSLVSKTFTNCLLRLFWWSVSWQLEHDDRTFLLSYSYELCLSFYDIELSIYITFINELEKWLYLLMALFRFIVSMAILPWLTFCYRSTLVRSRFTLSG